MVKRFKNKTQDVLTEGSECNGSSGVEGRLKFTKSLSLSAHSLRSRFAESGNKKSNKFSGSLSPSQQSYSSSPIFTSPPSRCCNTLHHTQPVRKTFKTIQQLEAQKQERKRELNIRRTLHRIPGTNKTYWKYNINNAAIVAQSTKFSRQQQQPNNSRASDLESNTSDEVDPEETQSLESYGKSKIVCPVPLQENYEGVNAETQSCSVPLVNDSVEMLSLMLTAASTAVNTTGEKPPDVAPTAGGFVRNFPKYLSLTRYPVNTNTNTITTACISDQNNEETVAYEAFQHTLSRRKSFSGERQRDNSLLRDSTSHVNDMIIGREMPALYTSAVSQQNRALLKSSSADVPNYTDFTINVHNKTGSTAGVDVTLTSPTIIANPSVTNLKLNKSYHNNKLPFLPTSDTPATTTIATKLQALQPAPMISGNFNDCPLINDSFNSCCSDDLFASTTTNGQKQHRMHGGFHCSENYTTTANISGPSDSQNPSKHHSIDDELEQHIKHCSCSCNHMGYGNSMDYQVNA
uniref:Uncharacterized protein n=1 Tax=Glossina austeni TaxID=7395 RepID=A0A1A9URY3_GLOAU